MARRISGARLKSNRAYTVREAAEIVGVTPPTVLGWIRQGLHALRDEKPFLILGCELKAFLAKTKANRKQPLGVGELYCLRCKTGTPPALAMVEYAPISPRHGRLHAFCAVCEGPSNRIVSAASLPDWAATCEISGNGVRQA